MIRFLRHAEIDKLSWDKCIRNAVNGIIYARSWYLDIVCPGWNALVEDDYSSVFPLTSGRKLTIRYLYQPFFTQQLGLFTTNHLTEALVERFLHEIPSEYKYAEIHLNSMNKVNPGNLLAETAVNLELDLIEAYENLKKNYDQNTKRNLKKATERMMAIERNVKPDELITLFRENFGHREGILKRGDYQRLRTLIDHCMKNTVSMITGVRGDDGALHAGIFFLHDGARWILHFAASDKVAKERGMMFLLIDNFIGEHAEKAVTLDFEGSNDPNVARFYKGFGARNCNYTRITLNRLPMVIRKVLKIKKQLRKR
ncbi:MAG: hypothetical protein WCL00_00460 [Bacteroidota bacterium]